MGNRHSRLPLANERPGASSSNPEEPSLPSTSGVSSARIQGMIENRSEFGSEIEFEIESSKVHWSELDPVSRTGRSGASNRQYFEELKARQDRERFRLRSASPGFLGGSGHGFFRDMDDLEVGEKIGQGAQAGIYAAGGGFYALKIFGSGFSLRDLERQWPEGMLLDKDTSGVRTGLHGCLYGATLLRDKAFLDRFAFVMRRQWGDLRKGIDLAMVQNHNRMPPFPFLHAISILVRIAEGMHSLHSADPPILHRDLKAANVLMWKSPIDHEVPDLSTEKQLLSQLRMRFRAFVADFECSAGVVGTGFWRAPEILRQVKKGVRSFDLKFTGKSDVYSFGMTCYEVLTGCIPFEGHSVRDYNHVLRGNRPQLPSLPSPVMEAMIRRCWHRDPKQRPEFEHIVEELTSELKNHVQRHVTGLEPLI